MNDVILDTNIYYALTGIYPNPKVDLKKMSDLVLWTTTATIVEGMVRFKDDLVTIKKILQPLLLGDVRLVRIGYSLFENDLLYKFSQAEAIELIKSDIDNIMKNKIETEAKFVRIIYILVFSGIAETIKKEEGYFFSDPKLNDLQGFLFKCLLESSLEQCLSTLKDAIRKGYENNNKEKSVILAINDLLKMQLNIFHFNYHQIKSGIFKNGKVSDLEADGTKVVRSLAEDDFYDKFNKYFNNISSIISEKKYIHSIDEFLNSMAEGFRNEKLAPPAGVSFMISKVRKILIHKAKIRINDVFDMLNLFSLDLEMHKIITLDKNLISTLEIIDPPSVKLIEDLGLR